MPILLDTPHYMMEQLDNGIVHVAVRGDFDVAILERFIAESEPHMVRLAPVLYMNDARSAGDAPLAAKWRLATLLRERAHLIKRSAAYGVPTARRLVFTALLRAGGRSGQVRFFDARADAERYLLEEP